MSDEQMERNAPTTPEPSPSEAEEDDSVEIADQPPSPEVSAASSTDWQPAEVPDSPAQPCISSVPQQGSNEAKGFELMRLLVANQPIPEDLRSHEVPWVSSRRNEQAGSTDGDAVIHAEMVTAAFDSAQVQEAPEAAKFQETTEASRVQSQAFVAEAVRCEAPFVEAERANTRWVETEPTDTRWVEASISVKRGFSQEIAKGSIKRKIDEEKTDDSNQQSSKSKSKSSPENVDLGRDSSPTGSGAPVEEITGSRCRATEGSGSSPKISAVIDENSNLVTGASKNVGLKSEVYSSKTSTTTPVSGSGATENIELEGKLLPSKTDKASTERSSSTSVTQERRDSVMPPKRKSPSKYQHLSPKRSAPFTTPDQFQNQNDSHMSTLLEKLDIKETEDRRGTSQPKRKSPSKYQHLSPKRSASFTSPDRLEKQSGSHMSTLLEEPDIEETEDRPGTSQSISGYEQMQNAETGEAGESLKEETEHGSDIMREDEETREENSERDDPEMDDANYI